MTDEKQLQIEIKSKAGNMLFSREYTTFDLDPERYNERRGDAAAEALSKGISLVNANLQGIRVGSRTIKNANLEGADLRDTSFTGTIFEGANFKNADLKGAIFHDVTFKNTDFRGADLRNLRYPHTHIENSDFENANLDGIDFTRVSFKNQRKGLEMPDTQSEKIVIKSKTGEVLFTFECYCFSDSERWNAIHSIAPSIALQSGINLANAELEGVILDSRYLKSPSFLGANLKNADFRSADIDKGIFEGADLRGASFRNARLKGCNFRNADLRGADLIRAAIEDVDFTGAKCVDLAVTGRKNKWLIGCGTPQRWIFSDIRIIMEPNESLSLLEKIFVAIISWGRFTPTNVRMTLVFIKKDGTSFYEELSVVKDAVTSDDVNASVKNRYEKFSNGCRAMYVNSCSIEGTTDVYIYDEHDKVVQRSLQGILEFSLSQKNPDYRYHTNTEGVLDCYLSILDYSSGIWTPVADIGNADIDTELSKCNNPGLTRLLKNLADALKPENFLPEKPESIYTGEMRKYVHQYRYGYIIDYDKIDTHKK